MTAQDVAQNLRQMGVSLDLDGDELVIDGPDSLLSPDIIEQIRPFKADLIELLADACPVCFTPLQEDSGEDFRRTWCLTPGHYDFHRALNGKKLKETGSQLFARARAAADAEGMYPLDDLDEAEDLAMSAGGGLQ